MCLGDMITSDPAIGEPLTFEEVKRLVEAASPAIELHDDPAGKGRFLVAKKSLKVGEIVLSEFPIFCGRTNGAQSKKACNQEFAEQALPENETFLDDDAVHPCSPLMDCLSAILLTKLEAVECKDKTDLARAKLKMRQLGALARSCVTEPMTDEGAQEILNVFKTEVRGNLQKDELCDLLRVVSSNRFSGMEGQLDLMFAGSMFEHSCAPNCFAGNWRRNVNQPRLYRALKDIEAGEALSISYMQLPELYASTAGRAEILAPWGFKCSCPRCVSQLDLARTFVCPACNAPELCPLDASPECRKLRCRKCNKDADDSYVERCLKLESVLDRIAAGEEPASVGDYNGDNNLIAGYHYAAFRAAWQTMLEGPTLETLDRYACAIDDVIQCVTRFNGDDPCDPNLLELYHIMAELETGDIDGQQHYLDLERATMMQHYPEEAARQDQEVWNMVTSKGPHGVLPFDASTDLGSMD